MGHTHEEKKATESSPFDAGQVLSLPAWSLSSQCTGPNVDPLQALLQHGQIAATGGDSLGSTTSLFGGMYDAGTARQPGRMDDLTSLTPAAGMMARGEFRGAPLRPGNALRAYS